MDWVTEPRNAGIAYHLEEVIEQCTHIRIQMQVVLPRYFQLKDLLENLEEVTEQCPQNLEEMQVVLHGYHNLKDLRENLEEVIEQCAHVRFELHYEFRS